MKLIPLFLSVNILHSLKKQMEKEYNVSYTYDALGNIVERKKLKGTSDAEQIAVTKTSYIQDENGTITYTQETQN